MISQLELSQELERLGYPTGIRRLTDWRQKDLLPDLQSQGRGPGRGKFFYWDEPDILQQALLLADAFNNRVTVERAALLLAFAGFDVDAKRTRQLWLEQLTRLERHFNKPQDMHGYADDEFWDTGVELARQSDGLPGVDEDAMEHLAVEGLKIVCSSDAFCHSAEELNDITSTINNFLLASIQQKQIAGSIKLTAHHTDRILALLRLLFGFSEIKALIRSCSLEQFRDAARYFQKLVQTAEHLALTFTADSTKTQTSFAIRAIFRAIFGPIVLPLLLKLLHEGHGKRLQRTERALDRYLRALKLGETKSAAAPSEKAELMKNAMPSIGKRFSVIWKNFDLFRLYHLQYDPRHP